MVNKSWISLTTDYGLSDLFVGVCHGVIARIAPEVRVLDVTHGVPRGDVRAGALTLAQAVPFFPSGVHVGVVDPGVGTARRGVVVVARDGLLVGPDNGLLLPAADALGGVLDAFELDSPEFQLAPVSATFHGRDVFAPAAAHLALGVAPSSFGPAVDDLERLALPAPTVRAGSVVAEVAGVDSFGNVQLTASASALVTAGFAAGDAVRVRIGHERFDGVVGRTFGDVSGGGLVVFGDSSGHMAVAVNGGSAAVRLGVGAGQAPECTVTAVR